jgi:hypothetical protein
VLLTGCGGSNVIKSFRLALAASGPLVSSLVNSGAIPQSKASAILQDFSDGAACADTLQSDFKLVAKDDPDARRKKLTASVTAMRCFRVIIGRQNFAAHPKVKTASEIADGILASLVIFYSETGEMRAEVGRDVPVSSRDEKAFEQELELKVKQLELAMKP